MNDLFTFATGKNRRALPSKRRARAPKVPYVDPAAMWRSLPPDTAEYLGAMAIAFFLAAEGMNAHDGTEKLFTEFENIMRESNQQLGDFLHLYFPRVFIAGNGRIFPRLPDLSALKKSPLVESRSTRRG